MTKHSAAPVTTSVPASALGLITVGDINYIAFASHGSNGLEHYFLADLLQRFLKEQPETTAILLHDKLLPSQLVGKVQGVRQDTLIFDQPQTQKYLQSLIKGRPAIIAAKLTMASPYKSAAFMTVEARRILAALGDGVTVLAYGSAPLIDTNVLRVKSVGNMASISTDKTQLILSRNADGSFTTVDPVTYGKTALARYKFYEVQAHELQSQLGRLAIPVPDHYAKLLEAGVIIKLDDNRVAVNLD